MQDKYDIKNEKHAELNDESESVFEEFHRGLYSFIPASVRYCKSICANAKLMYGEITALANEKGYCWASNQYFADLYECSTKSVSKWLGSLAENGFVELSFFQNSGQINQTVRRVKLSCKFMGYGTKVPGGMEQKFSTPLEQKFQEIIINNKDDNNRVYTHTQNIVTQSSIPLTENTMETQQSSNEELQRLTKEDKPRKIEKPIKKAYGEYANVMLSDDEVIKLKDLENGERAVKFLSEYIKMKPTYKVASHYLAIRKWVIDAVREKDVKAKEIEFREKRASGGGTINSKQSTPCGIQGKTSYDGLLK